MKLSIAILLFLSAVCAPVEAQWKKIGLFPGIACIYFFDTPQKPTEGVLGTFVDNDFWKTTDGGITWRKAFFRGFGTA